MGVFLNKHLEKNLDWKKQKKPIYQESGKINLVFKK